MTDSLTPVFAAELAKKLYPGMSPHEVLPGVFKWYEEFLQGFSHEGQTSTPSTPSKPPGFRRAPASAPVPVASKAWAFASPAPGPDPGSKSWTAPDLGAKDEEDQGENLQLQNVEESPEGLMQAFLAYVKESKKGASDLSRMAEVSYPTMLTWLKGVKVPRGANIQKLQAFLAKVREQG